MGHLLESQKFYQFPSHQHSILGAAFTIPKMKPACLTGLG